jgi:hypothetical protein
MTEGMDSDLGKSAGNPAAGNKHKAHQVRTKGSNSENTEPNPSNHCQYSGSNYYLERITVVLALIAAVASTFSAIYSGQQADIAHAQLSLADQAEKRQLRAHVLYESVILSVDGVKATAFLRFKNSAPTPAFNVTYWWDRRAIDPTKPSSLEFADTDAVSMDIGSGGYLDTDEKEISSVDIEAVRNHKKLIYVWGLIKYKDVFQRCQILSFAFQGTTTLSPGKWTLRGFSGGGGTSVDDNEKGDCPDDTKNGIAMKTKGLPGPIQLPPK